MLEDLRRQLESSLASLALIGEGDWTPQDLEHAKLARRVEEFLDEGALIALLKEEKAE